MTILNKVVYTIGALVVSAVLSVLVVFIIGYGEYMINSTGDIRWALFYVPHVIALIWYVRRSSKLGK